MLLAIFIDFHRGFQKECQIFCNVVKIMIGKSVEIIKESEVGEI